jgi:hypothetical protein
VIRHIYIYTHIIYISYALHKWIINSVDDRDVSPEQGRAQTEINNACSFGLFFSLNDICWVNWVSSSYLWGYLWWMKATCFFGSAARSSGLNSPTLTGWWSHLGGVSLVGSNLLTPTIPKFAIKARYISPQAVRDTLLRSRCKPQGNARIRLGKTWQNNVVWLKRVWCVGLTNRIL